MSANPFLKLFVASGYYDLATPPATVKYSVEHMRLPRELQKNIDGFWRRRIAIDVVVLVVDGGSCGRTGRVLRVRRSITITWLMDGKLASLAPRMSSSPDSPDPTLITTARLPAYKFLTSIGLLQWPWRTISRTLYRFSLGKLSEECRKLCRFQRAASVQQQYPHLIDKSGDEFLSNSWTICTACWSPGRFYAVARGRSAAVSHGRAWIPEVLFDHLWHRQLTGAVR